MAEIYANNAKGELASSVAAADTNISLKSGHTLPSVSGDDWFRATFYRWEYTGEGINEYDHEVVKVTDVGGSTLAVERALEGSAKDFDAGTPVELRWTAGAVGSLRTLTANADLNAYIQVLRTQRVVIEQLGEL